MPLSIDVWSDIACPWCYVGKRHLEAALEGFAHRDEVEVVWHSFELDPGAPKALGDEVSYVERLARKYRVPTARAQQMLDRMTQTGADRGIELRFDRIRAGNTFDAHRLLHLARERGVQDALKERLMRAYFTEGEPIGDPDALARLAGEIGLDAGEAREVLASDAFAEAVRADEARAAAYGITGVPCFVLAERFAVTGAQPAETLRAVLERAWREAEAPEPAVEEGAACGPDGC
ncbi:MAG TPA: DsbA family oxidoreductase [Sandaracinaceae bacterium LLY-WYZ-13_1]|nr:DsbA family oxidoreductase [Sandaracinaceae bacterium LLY-WYZ-13_1]